MLTQAKQGKGKYVFANGDSYEGQYLADKKHGVGKMVYLNNGHYFGNYKNGLKHGEGLFQYKNKDRYSGQWAFGKKHGPGTYIVDAYKVKLVGTWFEGQLEQGKWVLANGDAFSGRFEHNKPVGQGVWQLQNGNKVSGTYTQQFLENDGKPDDLNPIDPATNLKIRLGWTTSSISTA